MITVIYHNNGRHTDRNAYRVYVDLFDTKLVEHPLVRLQKLSRNFLAFLVVFFINFFLSSTVQCIYSPIDL